MICEVCGKQFRPSGKGSQQKYCSAKCRQKDYRRRKKNRPAQDRNSKPPVKAVETKQKPEQDLDQRSFERMMDGSMLDILRDNRDLLLKAMALSSRSRLSRSMSSMLPSIIRSKLRWSRSCSGFCFVSTALTGGLLFRSCAGLFFFRRR